MTQLELARKGEITAEIRSVAKGEGLDPEVVRKGLVKGRIVIPKNKNHRIRKICGIGEGLRTKINANIGTSKNSSSISAELKKLKISIDFGSDTIMDLSTGSNIGQTRRRILAKSTVPVGTVPIYEIAIRGLKKYGAIKAITIHDIFETLEEQAKDGVDFFTIHAGVTRNALDILRDNPRILDIVSRGGAFLAEWMLENDRENPFYQHFDKVLEISKRYDITLSLGDGLRPGAIADATDKPQLTELIALGELQKKALK